MNLHSFIQKVEQISIEGKLFYWKEKKAGEKCDKIVLDLKFIQYNTWWYSVDLMEYKNKKYFQTVSLQPANIENISIKILK